MLWWTRTCTRMARSLSPLSSVSSVWMASRSRGAPHTTRTCGHGRLTIPRACRTFGLSERAAVVPGRDTVKHHVAQPETALQPAAAYGHAAGRGRLMWRLHVDCGDLTLVDGDSLNLQGRRGRAVEMPSTCRGEEGVRCGADIRLWGVVYGVRTSKSTPSGGRGTARGGIGSRDGASAAEKVRPRPRRFAGSPEALRGRCRIPAARPTCMSGRDWDLGSIGAWGTGLGRPDLLRARERGRGVRGRGEPALQRCRSSPRKGTA